MSNVHRPIDVLDQQMDFIRFWQRNPRAEAVSESFAPVMAEFVHLNRMSVRDFMARRSDQAESIFVSSHIEANLWRMTEEYETDLSEGLQPEDLPCDHGFAWLEDPLYVTDIRGRQVSVRVIFWSRETNGVILSFFSDAMDRNDEVNQYYIDRGEKDLLLTTGRVPLLHLMPINWGRNIRQISLKDYEIAPLLKLEPNGEEEFERNKQRAADSQGHALRFAVALWEFMGEQIPRVAFPDRPLRRRLLREHSPLSEVKVVELRTQEGSHERSEHPQLVMWNHRWRSRGHWRKYRNKLTGEIVKVTWVRESIKGPAHLQLIEKDTVFNVRR
jgi:hypothetical protein